MSIGKLEFIVSKDKDGADIELDSMSLDATKAFLTLIESMTEIINYTPDTDNVRFKIVKGSAAIEALCDEDQLESIESSLDAILNKESFDDGLINGWRGVQSLFLANGLT